MKQFRASNHSASLRAFISNEVEAEAEAEAEAEVEGVADSPSWATFSISLREV